MQHRHPEPSEHAAKIIADAERIKLDTVFGMVDVVTGALAALIITPVFVPFALAAAAMAIPMDKAADKLQRRHRPMPKEWFVSVAARGGDDGRFFVGRLMENNGQVTMEDAIRFMAIETEAPHRTDPESFEDMSPSEARRLLIAYYFSNQSLFDKAAAATGKAIAGAASAAGTAALGAMKAIAHKFKVGV